MKKSFILIIDTILMTLLLLLVSCKTEYIGKNFVDPVRFSYKNQAGIVMLTMNSNTDGSKIYYTKDGTKPTEESNLYESELTISETTTIKAIAVKEGLAPSSVTSIKIKIDEKTISNEDLVTYTAIPETGSYYIYYLKQQSHNDKSLINYKYYYYEYKYCYKDLTLNDVAKEIEGYVPVTMCIRDNYIYIYYDKKAIEYTFTLPDGITFTDGTSSIKISGFSDESYTIPVPPSIDDKSFVGWIDSKNENPLSTFGTNNNTYIAKYLNPSDFDFSGVKVGDIVLTDGTYSSASEFLPANKNRVTGVVVKEPSDGNPGVMICVKAKEEWHSWCISSAEAYNKEIETLYGDEESGLMDGSKAWDLLKASCSDAVTNPEKYPAFNAAFELGKENFYATFAGRGWYLPTVAECMTIEANKQTIRNSLRIAGASYSLGCSYYTCNQVKENPTKVSYWYSGSGIMQKTSKNSDYGYSVFLHLLK